MIPIILSGGSGTRLWPVSRASFPKQFSNLFDQSLQTKALFRSQKVATNASPTWIVANKSLKDFTLKKAHEDGFTNLNLLFEPASKNTAAAIAFAVKVATQKNLSQEVFAVFPADQLILDEDTFISVVRAGEAYLKQHSGVVVLGIKPSYAATGYGYIQTQALPGAHVETHSIYKVKKFHEKPNEALAQEFLKDGYYFWNAGIFIFKPVDMVQLFKKYQPGLWALIDELKADFSNLDEIYQKLNSISIDYAIIEKLASDELHCIPADMKWSDVGSWDSVAEVYQSIGVKAPQVVEVDSKENFVLPHKNKAYAFIGCDNLMVIDTADATLICAKGESQQVKTVVEQLQNQKSQLVNQHVFEERPWGRFDILKEEAHFKSKVINVTGKSQISYQSHAHREEHWIITQGQGEVILNDEVIPVQAGSYVKIPQGAKHRIRNTTAQNLQFIEVQLGASFSEQDIVRYQDDYERAPQK